jgi:uncharacterized protein with HEPN domain
MPPTERDRLVHMLEAARDAVQFSAGRARADLTDDRMLRRALIQCIEVIGEASVHLSPQTRASLPDVPWRSVRGMRNYLAHTYFNVDLDVLWTTVTQDIPTLASALQLALGQPGGDES